MPESASQTEIAVPQNDPTKPTDASWGHVMGLPCNISIEVPMPGFAVKDLLDLRPQSVVSSQWLTTANLPLKANGELIAWCEFEVLGNRIAVRLTELA